MLNKLICLHILASFIYFIIRTRQNSGRAFCEGMIALMFPGFGLAFLLLTLAINSVQSKNEELSYMETDYNNDYIPLQEHENRELTVLPMHDVLLLDDTKTKRELLSDAIKRDVLSNSDALLKAIRDEDSEISHYAVSMVKRKMSDLEAVFYRLSKELKETPDNLTLLKDYADVVDVYLKSSFMDEVSKKKLQQDFAENLERLLSFDKTEKKYFLLKINCEIDLKNYKKAEEFCNLFLVLFSDSEEPHILNIKLSYYLQDRQKIKQAIARLKASETKFSNRAMEIVRFWDGSECNAL
jgi:hypothetical protein